MTNTIKIIQRLNTPTPRKRTQPVKSRLLRRQEEGDRIRSAKANAQK